MSFTPLPNLTNGVPWRQNFVKFALGCLSNPYLDTYFKELINNLTYRWLNRQNDPQVLISYH